MKVTPSAILGMRVGADTPNSARTLMVIFSESRPFLVVMIITPLAPRDP